MKIGVGKIAAVHSDGCLTGKRTDLRFQTAKQSAKCRFARPIPAVKNVVLSKIRQVVRPREITEHAATAKPLDPSNGHRVTLLVIHAFELSGLLSPRSPSRGNSRP